MFSVRTFSKKVCLSARQGFTLIELMIVVAVIAILATIALFGLGGVQKGARDTQRLATVNGIRTALERFNANQGSYPTGAFTAMANSLTANGYLTNVFDPGCGSGTVLLNNIADANGNWNPCGTTVAPSYNYTQSGGVYTLLLFKEAAGIATLRGPQ